MNQSALKLLANKVSNKVLSSEKDGNFYNTPFKHCVIDNFFDDKLANDLYKSFPVLDDKIWEKTNDQDIEIKYRLFLSEFDVLKS